jgi:signal transduction histidine kinase
MGLVLAIRDLAENAVARGGLVLELDLPEHVGGLSPEVEQCYYRVAQEALENVIKHASATRVAVLLQRSGGQLVLEISDDGLGLTDGAAVREEQFGIRGMQERAELIGGTLEVESQAGQGTAIRLSYGGNE